MSAAVDREDICEFHCRGLEEIECTAAPEGTSDVEAGTHRSGSSQVSLQLRDVMQKTRHFHASAALSRETTQLPLAQSLGLIRCRYEAYAGRLQNWYTVS